MAVCGRSVTRAPGPPAGSFDGHAGGHGKRQRGNPTGGDLAPRLAGDPVQRDGAAGRLGRHRDHGPFARPRLHRWRRPRRVDLQLCLLGVRFPAYGHHRPGGASQRWRRRGRVARGPGPRLADRRARRPHMCRRRPLARRPRALAAVGDGGGRGTGAPLFHHPRAGGAGGPGQHRGARLVVRHSRDGRRADPTVDRQRRQYPVQPPVRVWPGPGCGWRRLGLGGRAISWPGGLDTFIAPSSAAGRRRFRPVPDPGRQAVDAPV